MDKIVTGQRFMSLAEPELGLGLIQESANKKISISFPLANEVRQYGLHSAPLKRIKFEIGDDVSSNDGRTFQVTQLEVSGKGLLIYLGENEEDILIESDILNSISFNRPEEKLLNAHVDSSSLFQLRFDTFKFKAWLATSPVRGFIGGRLSLIDHQYYLADKVTKRLQPRVLLADEVGLGKTIETGLILHKLILTGRAERVLVVTPSTLNFQWFIEMLRKYNLTFTVINEQTEYELDTNPFDENNLVITSIEFMTESQRDFDMAAKSKWDILVVDEAHKLQWHDSEASVEYERIEKLSTNIDGLLLLSATPEIYGLEGHFSHLKLIDPDKFHDFEKFKAEDSNYKEIAKKGRELAKNSSMDANDEEIVKLIDQHGPGRVYFRNTRDVIDKKHQYFPKRNLKEYKLANEEHLNLNDQKAEKKFYAEKIQWLVKFLSDNQNEKMLLICHSKEKVGQIEKDINELSVGNKIAIFHEDLSLMARDRNAAYFREENGANILLCSEIGSEGRNFQFCQNLILFDLPLIPDLLEQRIGRLDRIGQKDNIFIHVPYLENSWEEILFNWYHNVFSSFTSLEKGCAQVSAEYIEDLISALNNVELSIKENKVELLIQRGQESFKKLNTKLQEGRDVLIELNSFNQSIATKLTDEVKEIDQSTELKKYLEAVYTNFGVDVEDLDDNSQFVKPSVNMFIPHFPFLTEEGFSYTYDRQVALEREELSFMSWDHPMVTGIIDLISGEEFGNVTLMTREGGKPRPFVESFYLLDSKAPKDFEIGRFLPPTIIRILVDMEGNEFSDKWSKEMLDSKLIDAGPEIINKVSKISKSNLKKLLAKTKLMALTKQVSIIKDCKSTASKFYENEIERLVELQKINPAVGNNEIALLVTKKEQTLQYIVDTKVSIDSFRFIY